MNTDNSKKKYVNKRENNGKITATKNAKKNKRNDGESASNKEECDGLVCIEPFTKSHSREE